MLWEDRAACCYHALGCSYCLLSLADAVWTIPLPFLSPGLDTSLREAEWTATAMPDSSCLVLFLQLVSEKVGGAEGTKLDDDFKEMEKVSKG